MGMSTHVQGFRPPDERWQFMKEAWDACEKAGVEPPESVVRFFEGEEPDPEGVEVDLGDALAKWSDQYREGFQVDLTKLPNDIKLIRFYNSW